MLELYFIFYRTPKIMTRLARERSRSALAWSLLGIAAWIGGELFVGLALTTLYEVGAIMFGWSKAEPAGFKLLTYLLALIGAIVSVTIVARILQSKSKEVSFPAPPPPPKFSEMNS
jgi:hypothetical protein